MPYLMHKKLRFCCPGSGAAYLNPVWCIKSCGFVAQPNQAQIYLPIKRSQIFTAFITAFITLNKIAHVDCKTGSKKNRKYILSYIFTIFFTAICIYDLFYCDKCHIHMRFFILTQNLNLTEDRVTEITMKTKDFTFSDPRRT